MSEVVVNPYRFAISMTEVFAENYDSTTGWTQNGGITIDSASYPNVCHFNAIPDNNWGNYAYKSMGVTVSDTEQKSEIFLGDLSASGDGTNPYCFQLSDGTNTTITSANQDMIGFQILLYSNDAPKDWRIAIISKEGSNALTRSTGNIQVTDAPSGKGDYYLSLHRTTSTNVDLHIYEGTWGGTEISGSPVSHTISSSIGSLSNVLHCGGGDGGAGGGTNLDFDNLTVYEP